MRTTESRGVEFNSTQVYTYSDIEKNFSTNASFGKIFTSKMSQNKKSTNYKSIYFARLESTIFDVIFEPDYKNFFYSTEISADLKNITSTRTREKSETGSVPARFTQFFTAGAPYYIRNMSYGNYAYLAIESEYSFSEVKKAIEGTFNLWKIDAGAKYDQKTIDILSKSSVTLMVSDKANNSSNATETYWATSLDKLMSIFTVKYNENYIGAPTFVEVRDVVTNKIYLPPVSVNDGG